MNDRLDDLIRRASRKGASADFTERVMSRVKEAPDEPRMLAWKPAFAAAAFVLVSLASGIAFEKSREAERVEALRVEARQLEAELEELKKQTEMSSRVYLGGNDNREYVLDLRDLTAPASQAQTVSHSY